MSVIVILWLSPKNILRYDFANKTELYNFPIGVPATDFIISSFGVHMLTVNSN